MFYLITVFGSILIWRNSSNCFIRNLKCHLSDGQNFNLAALENKLTVHYLNARCS